ncbi:hypothetical protein F383_32259 [Gossypium arboreum]|uniref:Uncharacterized protein n=1 Tax=Gossypium arboreum TaxID=29729 RepID=A0A0B0N4D8_GOSAR|nr:hypothetical protein F383_32259 [Gossypium arboreum]
MTKSLYMSYSQNIKSSVPKISV